MARLLWVSYPIHPAEPFKPPSPFPACLVSMATPCPVHLQTQNGVGGLLLHPLLTPLPGFTVLGFEHTKPICRCLPENQGWQELTSTVLGPAPLFSIHSDSNSPFTTQYTASQFTAAFYPQTEGNPQFRIFPRVLSCVSSQYVISPPFRIGS